MKKGVPVPEYSHYSVEKLTNLINKTRQELQIKIDDLDNESSIIRAVARGILFALLPLFLLDWFCLRGIGGSSAAKDLER